VSNIPTPRRPSWRHLDVQIFDSPILPIGLQYLGLEVELVEIGAALTEALDLDEALSLKLFDMGVNALA